MCTIVSTPPAGLPMGRGVCVLRRWKRVAETSSHFMEVPSRTKQDGEGGKERLVYHITRRHQSQAQGR